MRVAIVQDWLTVNGGAEKVLKEIIHCFPDADLFSLIDFMPDDERKDCLHGKKATTSWLQKLPFVEKYYRNLLPFFPNAIESLDFTGYDLIISSSYSVAKGIKKTDKKQVHICYCHSPVRYAWDLKDQYLKEMPWLKRIVFKSIIGRIAKWDLKTVDRVDYFIANSNNVKERISRIYKRDADVLYPPVNLSEFTFHQPKKDFYFTSARLVPYKKVDLIVKAFKQLPNLKLIVGGTGPELTTLKKIASKNVRFLGYLPQVELIQHYKSAKAFILAANEDFGITSLEAQASGTPVISLRAGGYLETVLEGGTGLFFNEQNVESLTSAILDFEKNGIEINKLKLVEHVNSFSTEEFRRKLLLLVKKYSKFSN